MKPRYQLKTTAHTSSNVASRGNAPESTDYIGNPVHRIVHGECLDMMAKIPDQSIDFICADFPYNISGKGGVTLRGEQIVAADFGEWDKFPSEEAYLDFVFAVCTEYRRILKPNVSMVLFFGYRQA